MYGRCRERSSPDSALAFAYPSEHHITFPILINPNDRPLLFYKARSLPRTYVIAPDGMVALSIIGPMDEERFDAWFDEHGIATESVASN